MVQFQARNLKLQLLASISTLPSLIILLTIRMQARNHGCKKSASWCLWWLSYINKSQLFFVIAFGSTIYQDVRFKHYNVTWWRKIGGLDWKTYEWIKAVVQKTLLRLFSHQVQIFTALFVSCLYKHLGKLFLKVKLNQKWSKEGFLVKLKSNYFLRTFNFGVWWCPFKDFDFHTNDKKTKH